MSEQYYEYKEGKYACRACGVKVDYPLWHDAFHDRIDRLEVAVQTLAALTAPEPPEPAKTRITEADIEQHARDMFEPETILMHNYGSGNPDTPPSAENPDKPVCPFPMGAKVRHTKMDYVTTVTGFEYENPDCDGEAGWYIQLANRCVVLLRHAATMLELVPEPEPLLCAVCGEPVKRAMGPRGGLIHVEITEGHAATLTPPEHDGPCPGMGGPMGCSCGQDTTPTEPPVGSGWFADRWPGVLWFRANLAGKARWAGHISGNGLTTYKVWPDLLPGRPAVPGGER